MPFSEEKARNRIVDWKNKALSFARRLQLCKSVISSMQVYWAYVLVIPHGIVSDIQQLIRGFLWCNGEYKRGKAKVVWDDICLPKREGGLGIRSLEVFNLALMTTHIWNIVSNKESLWVRWIHTYKLRGRTFWDVQPKQEMSWGWRKLLQLRDIVKPFFWVHIAREGYTLKANVADLLSNGNWNWPLAWLAKAPNLTYIPAPILDNNRPDCIRWCDSKGNMDDFSVKLAWEELRPRGNEVLWFHIVWFAHCIPRHAFHFWLVMRRSLKTQDKLRPWDVAPNKALSSLRCLLCGLQMDSHEHLFFECGFSAKVWYLIRNYEDMDLVCPKLDEIMMWLQPLANKRTFKAVMGKLLFVASSYYIWRERNNRLFKNARRTPEEIRDLIIVIVFGFKNVIRVQNLLALWKMPSSFRLYGS
ncbi:homeodomain-like protein [Tanacetum coccineum]